MVNPYFKTRYAPNKSRLLVWREVAFWLKRFIPCNAKLLDLGAGYCDLINNITAQEKHALDIEDISPYAAPDVICHKLDVKNLAKFKERDFDVIAASNIFEHFNCSELDLIFKNLKNLLKSDGRLIVIQPNFFYCYRKYFDDYTHKSIFTHNSFCDFLKAQGFSITRCIPKFLPYSLKSAQIPITRLMVRFYLWSPIKPKAGSMLVVAKLLHGF